MPIKTNLLLSYQYQSKYVENKCKNIIFKKAPSRKLHIAYKNSIRWKSTYPKDDKFYKVTKNLPMHWQTNKLWIQYFYFIPKPSYLYLISIKIHWYTGVCINIVNYNVKRSWLVPRDLKRFPCKRYKELPQPHLINTQVHACLIKRTHWTCGIKVILITYLDVLLNRLLSSKHVLLID